MAVTALEYQSGFERLLSMRERESGLSASRLRLVIIVGLVVWIVVSALVHLVDHSTSLGSGGPIFQGATVSRATTGILLRACSDCHSESTKWPWYGRVAPFSWIVESDVYRARRRMNFSRWQNSDTDEQIQSLRKIAEALENREMPPRRYAFLHPEAKLTPDEVVEVIEWTRAERRRLRGLSGRAETAAPRE